MYIYCLTETPHGAQATAHRIHKLEIDTEVRVTVNSFATEAAEMLVWQDVYVMPVLALGEGTYPENVLTWLTSETGPFSTGEVIADADELGKEQTKYRAIISDLRVKNISKGVKTPFGVVDSDDVSIRNIMASYQAAVLSLVAQQPFEMSWRLLDNTSVEVDAQGMIAIGNAVLQHTKLCYERSWELKEQIGATETIDELQAIDLNSGWPE